MPTEFTSDVFLSRNSEDRPRVRRLVPAYQLSTIDFQRAAGCRFIPLLLGDCALQDKLRRYADTCRRDLHPELIDQV